MSAAPSPSLWQRLIDTVDAHRRRDDLAEAVLRAAFLFEKTTWLQQVSTDPALAERGSGDRGWTDDVMAEPIDPALRTVLIDSLCALAGERPDDPAVSSVFWALGRAYEKRLVPFFQRALATQVDRNPDAVYQILIALDNLGEEPFAGRQLNSVMNVAENVAMAKAYLDRLPSFHFGGPA